MDPYNVRRGITSLKYRRKRAREKMQEAMNHGFKIRRVTHITKV